MILSLPVTSNVYTPMTGTMSVDCVHLLVLDVF